MKWSKEINALVAALWGLMAAGLAVHIAMHPFPSALLPLVYVIIMWCTTTMIQQGIQGIKMLFTKTEKKDETSNRS